MPDAKNDLIGYLTDVYGEDFWLYTEELSATNASHLVNNSVGPSPAENGGEAGDVQHGPLASYREEIKDCQKCPLGKTRIKFVFGTGKQSAELMLIGEAPGADEDRQGEPFVGKAGKMLDKILTAIDHPRETVFIANILKCRPPKNRDPLPDEVASCRPYLDRQIEIIRPKAILLLGRVAANALLEKSDSLASMRGKVHDYKGIPVYVTYHPAALLRNPNWKRPTWEDVQQVRDFLHTKKDRDE
jgi:uracil-DNA glycosylase family 4